MMPIRCRRAPLIRACMLAVISVGIVPTMAQAQQIAVAETQIAVGGNLAPLKLPPLPRKKFPTKKFDDWTQHCKSRPGVPGQNCVLTQTIVQTKNQRKQGLLAITVGFLGPEKKPSMLLRVPLGLGVYLPPGFKYTVPGVEPIRMVIQSCLPTGCSARTDLSPDIIAAMKNSDAGALELHTIRKQLIRVPISFKGFSAALATLNED